ncbi:MAG: PQQ-binding-like beta-propeller repeat protein, partial [bacterium]
MFKKIVKRLSLLFFVSLITYLTMIFLVPYPYKEIWKLQIDEKIVTTPLHHNGNIYLCTEPGNLYKVNEQGEIQWKLNLNYPLRPVIYKNKILVATQFGYIYIINSNGKIEWEKRIKDFKPTLKPTLLGINRNFPIVHNKLIYIASGGNLLALKNKKLFWHKNISYNQINNITFDKDDNIYAKIGSDELIKMNSNGKLIWSLKDIYITSNI